MSKFVWGANYHRGLKKTGNTSAATTEIPNDGAADPPDCVFSLHSFFLFKIARLIYRVLNYFL
jgi:hypothetical protein